MKLIHISDTHNKHDGVIIPDCDILIHSGDFTGVGQEKEMISFMEWFSKQEGKHKIMVAGNHDRCFDSKYDRTTFADFWLKKLMSQYPEITYLENQEIIIENLKFWGSPYTPWFFGDKWAFNKHRGEEIMEVWKLIPKDADVIITHGPAFGHMDWGQDQNMSIGCEDLRLVIDEIKPLAVICGHCHESYGIKERHYENSDKTTIFSNASICDLRYNPINKPNIIEI